MVADVCDYSRYRQLRSQNMKRLLIAAGMMIATSCFADSYIPATMNLQINAGEDYAATVRLSTCSSYTPLSGLCRGTLTPVNLTGYSFQAQIRATAYSSAVLGNFSTSTVPSTGNLTWKLSHQTTLALFGKSGYWDLRMTAPDGSLSYLLKGSVTFTPRITYP
jgi:hypothetical protein